MPISCLAKTYRILFSVCFLLLLSQCENVDQESSYQFLQPVHFPEATYTFEKNPVTEKGFELGRVLFYDPMLSRDGSISCNSCHIQATAFADAQQHPFSIGVDDQKGIRNAPPLMNLAFMDEFLWDGGITHLDFVAVNAIKTTFEMDETIENVMVKLNRNSQYKKLFKDAFGIDSITSPYMLQALSQFMVLMVSDQSRFDDFIRGDEKALTDTEIKGMKLFEEKCAQCHSGTLQSDFSYRNNGISTTFPDKGRGKITETSSDIGKFRVPSLRNVALTAPYMHDASFISLDQVLEHYRKGIVVSETLDSTLIDGISMTDDEKSQIIAFLHSLTDKSFTSDQRFTNPQ